MLAALSSSFTDVAYFTNRSSSKYMTTISLHHYYYTPTIFKYGILLQMYNFYSLAIAKFLHVMYLLLYDLMLTFSIRAQLIKDSGLLSFAAEYGTNYNELHKESVKFVVPVGI